MKVCVTSEGNTLDAKIDQRFGRCQYFIFVDAETLEFETIENPNISASGGAGIQSAQLVAQKEVKAILTGNVGPNAFQTLQAAKIDVVTSVSGNVKDAIEKYKRGELKPTQGPSVKSKFGMPGRG